jgi:hypothetical protein
MLIKNKLLQSVLIVIGLHLPSEFSASAAQRVALMNLICEENSHRSTLAAIDFTAALQAQLLEETKFEWVERAELGKAERELQLADFGLIDRAESIRSGRWVKADWAIFGTISTNLAAGRRVHFEVVDMQRADVLSETNIVLAPRIETHFQVLAGDVFHATSALRGALDAAVQAHNLAYDQTAVAILFFNQNGRGEGFEDLAREFRTALEIHGTKSNQFRLIQFQRTEAAMDEANLVLSGLAESSPDAWEKVADQYIWGSYTVDNQKVFDQTIRKLRDENRVLVKLNVWDGKTDSHSITLSFTNLALHDVTQQLLSATVPFLHQNPDRKLSENTRQRISESLVGHAIEMAKGENPYLGTQQGVRNWLAVVQVLETACFFDPGNQIGRELWMRVRWKKEAERVVHNKFFFARRRSEAWKKHVEQFGFITVCPPGPIGWWETNSIASEYVLSAWRPFEMFNYAQENQAEWGVPRDAGGPELSAWRTQFAEDLFARVLRAPEDAAINSHAFPLIYGVLALNGSDLVVKTPQERQRVIEKLWPSALEAARSRPVRFDDAYLRGLKLHFQEMGKPGREQDFLEPLNHIIDEREKKEHSLPAKLPRFSEFNNETKESQTSRTNSFRFPHENNRR